MQNLDRKIRNPRVIFRFALATAMALASIEGSASANPDLTPGIWKNITPAGINLAGNYGTAFIQMDPGHPEVIYATADMQGLWKTTDAGSTWARLGTPPTAPNYGSTTDYLDSPVQLAIDPADPQHLYATQGVRGTTQGFWVSTDGGAHWALPAGFLEMSTEIGTRDMTSLAVDPSDFKHALVGSHSGWMGLTNTGILETKDGGTTWIAHPPVEGFTAATMGVNFLFDPDKHIGNAKTWLIGTDGNGLWRTEDGGEHFKRVTPVGVWPDFSISHGGQFTYYSTSGVLYAGAFVYPIRSTDNGLTWTSITSGGAMTYSSYYAIQGDGEQLYTMRSFADNTAKYNASYMVSLESDGVNWKAYEGGAQKFDNGPYSMRFDKTNHILYSANWSAGIWALKVKGPDGIRSGDAGRFAARRSGDRVRTIVLSGDRLVLLPGMAGRTAELHDLRGHFLARAVVGADGTVALGAQSLIGQVVIVGISTR